MICSSLMNLIFLSYISKLFLYGCESWIIKKAENFAFELWCWRRLLRVPWTTRRSNQSILKEIDPEHSLEGLMLKLKLQYFWPPDVKNWLIGKEPDAGHNWRQEVKGTTEDEVVGWHNRLDGHDFEQAPGVGDGQGSPACCSSWGGKELDSTEQVNWTDSLSEQKTSKVKWHIPQSFQKKKKSQISQYTSDQVPGKYY